MQILTLDTDKVIIIGVGRVMSVPANHKLHSKYMLLIRVS